ncbi:SurA N-terminal domain-containing protein [Amphibacillus sp. MSJ-3]|uniref:SurA N-terminal domain-containing protein n=1 Tax=Amphibacillus sp. MSJ-3 TaxID=2841505 RepID=UPI001C0EE3D8|nr:SurA N-terminal domain-containing protein [Amphibacillus sp. MSJ-3]
MFKKIIISGWLLLLSIVLLACNDDVKDKEELSLDQDDEIVEMPEITDEQEEIVTEDELLDEDSLVLIINGEEVYGDNYNLVYYETKNSMNQDKENASKDLTKIHEETMTTLIRQTLLAQDAYEKGIVITDEEVDAIYQETKAQFDTEDDFYQVLDQLPYSEEVFRDILAKSLLQQYYIDQEFDDIQISDQDVESFYALLKEEMEDAPDLDDIRSEIKSRLLQIEIQNALNDRLDQLLEEAEIEEVI